MGLDTHMSSINCQLFCTSSAEHLSQIYTGFGLLAQQGVIKVQLSRLPGYEVGVLARPKLRIVLNNRIKIVYDTYDGQTIYDDELEWCDFYFKRSFNADAISEIEGKEKIFPLGFNYPVYGIKDYSFSRIIWGGMSSKSIPDLRKTLISVIRLSLLSYFLKTGSGKRNALYSFFEDLPRFDKPKLVIFFARLWDPGRSQEIQFRDERERMNQMRVEIIRKMTKNLGEFFVGGLEPTEFSLKYYKDCVVQDPHIVYKKNYLNLLKHSSIGIATQGLLKSNGWKIGEYIAGAKAVVSESLFSQVPGNFLPSRNYLLFSSSDEAIEQVIKLLENPQLRYEMMVENYAYYHLFLRPNMLIWNTLKKAFLLPTNNPTQ